MDYSGEDLEAIFNNDVPHSLQRAIIRCVFNAYGTAFDAVKHFPREEARDLRGYYRWVQLRYEMRGIFRAPGRWYIRRLRCHTVVALSVGGHHFQSTDGGSIRGRLAERV